MNIIKILIIKISLNTSTQLYLAFNFSILSYDGVFCFRQGRASISVKKLKLSYYYIFNITSCFGVLWDDHIRIPIKSGLS